MPVPAGTRFGPYQIAAPLGEGGMGEVYRATDTRLGRNVALKVLAADAIREPVARARFEREARLIAQLQHPHICVLHDVGFEGDTPYLVMELLAGETLEARLKRGRLSLDDALTIGTQIAQALDAAHRQGIVHRDLKPANVILVKTPGASAIEAKLLDFGVARPVAEATATAATAAMTMVTALTDRRTLVGTLPYMAPEQLAGRPADGRTDLWALGCVLYEMASGMRPFTGQTTVELVASIQEQAAPSLAERMPLTPPLVDHLVRRCLEKDPERRWQTARDIASELDWARARGADGPARRQRPASRGLVWSGFGVAAAVAALVAFTATYRRDGEPSRAPVTRLSIPAPPDTTFLGGRAAPYFALSPDARRVALVPTPYRRSASIWVRELDDATARLIPETVGATFPFWSPDGTHLGFFADGKLKVVDHRSGRPLTIRDAPSPRGGTWNQFNDILFTPSLDSGTYRVAASGGEPVAVTTLDASRRESNHKLPAFLPDGRHFTFVSQAASAQETGVYIGSLDSTTPRRLLDVASKVQFASGFLWYAKDGALVAQAFEPDTLQVAGPPQPVGEDIVFRNTVIGDALFSVATDGTAIVWNGPQAAMTELTWYDRPGRRLGSTGTPDRHFSIALSPDGRTIAAEIPDPEGPLYNIWTIDVATGLKSRVTSGSINWGPVWSPDSERIAYGSVRGGPSQVYQRGLTGAVQETNIWKSAEFVGPTGWLPDGKAIVLLDVTHYRLGVLALNPSSSPTWVSNTGFVEGDGRVSPDGRWFAYTSNESGMWDVYVKAFPSLDRKWRVSPAGGSGPTWRSDSAELYYIDRDQHLMAVKVRRAAAPLEGPPTQLFALPVVPTPPGIDPRLMYAPTSSGDRFLVNSAVEAGSQVPLTIVSNILGRLRNTPQ